MRVQSLIINLSLSSTPDMQQYDQTLFICHAFNAYAVLPSVSMELFCILTQKKRYPQIYIKMLSCCGLTSFGLCLLHIYNILYDKYTSIPNEWYMICNILSISVLIFMYIRIYQI